MDKYEQILKMASAAEILQQLVNADLPFADDLQVIVDNIADIADELEATNYTED